jgi:ABC-type multidrug transport system fused ATPase/permease subunit
VYFRLPEQDLVRWVITKIGHRQIRKLIAIQMLQFFSSLVDLLALALLGYFIASTLREFQNPNGDAAAGNTITLPNGVSISFNGMNLGLLIILFFTIRTVFTIFLNRKTIRFLSDQSSLISQDLGNQLFKNKSKMLLSMNPHEVVFGITAGVDRIVVTFLSSYLILINEMVFSLIIGVYLLLTEWYIGIALLILFSISTWYIRRHLSVEIKQLGHEQTKLQMEFTDELFDSISVHRELRLRGSETRGVERSVPIRNKYLELNAKAIRIPLEIRYGIELAMILSAAAVFSVLLLTKEIESALVALSVYVAAATRVVPSIVRMQNSFLEIRRSSGISSLTLRIEKELGEVSGHISSKLERSDFIPEVIFKGVAFNHQSDSNFHLKDINLQIKPGSFVAFVGDSGSGKSTILDLITGLLTPSKGEVLISGIGASQAIRIWPGLVSLVPQKVNLISGGIFENVFLSEFKESRVEELSRLLTKANLVKFLESESVLQSNDVRLNISGGEGQRIGIARALATTPKLIVLDEATSSLDSLTERVIVENIYHNRGEATIIVAAHRLSTLKFADQIYFVDNGNLLASGTLEELTNAVPKFAAQVKAFEV